MGEAKRHGGAGSFDRGALEKVAVGAALSGAILKLTDMPSSGVHFYGPEPDIIAEIAVTPAVAVWGQPILSWTMPLEALERELKARDGQCVVLDGLDAASPEQVEAVLAAIGKVRLAVVSWGVGSVASKVGVDRALDVVVDVPVPKLKSARRATGLPMRVSK